LERVSCCRDRLTYSWVRLSALGLWYTSERALMQEAGVAVCDGRRKASANSLLRNEDTRSGDSASLVRTLFRMINQASSSRSESGALFSL